MTRAEDVEARIRKNAFAGGIAPDYDGFGLANVAPTVLAHFGAATTRPGLSPDLLPPALLEGVERVVLVVVDGLGWEQFRRSRFATLMPEHAPMTSVLPSTTAAALASLSTGEPPGTHGILGYRSLLPRLGAVTNMIRMQPYYSSRTWFDLGIEPADFFPFDTLVGRLGDAAATAGVVTRNAYVRSELSRMIYRGIEPDGYVGLGDMMVRARRFLAANRDRRAFLEIYWDEVDVVAHRDGPGSEEHDATVRALADAVERELLPAVADDPGALLLLTADHGHVHVEREDVLDLNARPHLLDDLLLPPTGEGRLAYLHPRDGRREAVRRAFEDEFGDAVQVFDGEALVRDGRFGPPPHHAELLSRIGTLVAVPQGARKFEYHPTPGTGPKPLLGNHGGVAPAEMLVPFALLRG